MEKDHNSKDGGRDEDFLSGLGDPLDSDDLFDDSPVISSLDLDLDEEPLDTEEMAQPYTSEDPPLETLDLTVPASEDQLDTTPEQDQELEPIQKVYQAE